MTALSIATLVSAGSLAIAQDAGVNAGAGAGVNAETPAGDVSVGTDANAGAATTTDTTKAGANANANANANAGGMSDNTYGSVMSSISGSASVDLSGVTDEANVTIVLLSSLQGNAANEASALDEALSADAEGQTTLHANIDANATIKAKLESEGYASSDVVAVKSNADGSVIVYVDDRA
ncbi:hypothetical protein [Devosia lucknowensis]|nr:hypothetical protein [Devosia lucknowensis]